MPKQLARVDTRRPGMGAPAKTGGFQIRQIRANDHGFKYTTFQVVGYLSGERVHKKFKSREEALGEFNRLEVLAANVKDEPRLDLARAVPFGRSFVRRSDQHSS
ncbi:MAG: hypothetical protein ACREF9_14135 [Opitutaceae bacterium]